MTKKRVTQKSNAPNKSQAIREHYDTNPNAKPQQVAAALKKKGIVVSPAFVSTIRSNSKKKGVAKRGRPAGKKAVGSRQPAKSDKMPASGPQDVTIDSLLKVKKVVEELGGLGNARAVLSVLEKLQD